MKRILIFVLLSLVSLAVENSKGFKEIKIKTYSVIQRNNKDIKSLDSEMSYLYNKDGKIIRDLDGGKINKEYEYDSFGNLIVEKFQEGKILYTYLENKIVKEEKKEEKIEYKYQGDNLIEKISIKPNETYLIKNIYDKKNNRITQMHYINGKEIEKSTYKYDSKNELIEYTTENGEGLLKTVYQTIVDKNGFKTEITNIENYWNGELQSYGSWHLETIYDQNNLKIEDIANGNRVEETYYKYDKNKNLIETLIVGALGNWVTYYKYKNNNIVEEAKYEYILDLWSESDYQFPNVSKNEPKKLKKLVTYDYLPWNTEENISFYEKLRNIIKTYKTKNDLIPIINNLEDSGIKNILTEKPESFTDAQYISILNDYAYFLSETDRYKEAMPILERVIMLEQNRVVAYLNLGDCYYKEYQKSKSESDKDKIIENYKKYVGLLKKDAKVPDRVEKVLGGK